MDEMGIDYLCKDCEPYFPAGEIREIMKKKWFEYIEQGIYSFNEGEKLDSKGQYLLNSDDIPITRLLPYNVVIPEDDPTIYIVGSNRIEGFKFNFNNATDRDKFRAYWENKNLFNKMEKLNYKNDEDGIKAFTEAHFLQPYEEGLWEGYLYRPLNRHDLYNYLEYLISDPKPRHYIPITEDLLMYDDKNEVIVNEETGKPLFYESKDVKNNMTTNVIMTTNDNVNMDVDKTNNQVVQQSNNTTTNNNTSKKKASINRGVVSDSLSDHYTTPSWCVEKLVDFLVSVYGQANLTIYDPCCGKNRIIGLTLKRRALEDYGINYTIIEDDLYHHPDNKNFLLNTNIPYYEVLITNPPYSGRNKLNFLTKVYKSGKPWAMLLPLQSLVPVDNMRLFYTYGVKIFLLTPSPRFLDDNGKEKSIRECGWFFWDGDFTKNKGIEMQYFVKKTVRKNCHCELSEYVDYFENMAKESLSGNSIRNDMDDDDALSKSEESVLDMNNLNLN